MNWKSVGKVFGSVVALGLSLAFCGCGAGPICSTPISGRTEAQESGMSITGYRAGVTPFISSVEMVGQNNSCLSDVTFTISPKQNAVSQPVSVTWSRAALSNRGYLKDNLLSLPVFGLYEGYENQVSFNLSFDDGSVQQLQYQIPTESYIDPTGIYMNPTILKPRVLGSNLGFNFFIMKSAIGSPVIVDTDGLVRWVVPATGSISTYFANGHFVVGSGSTASDTLLKIDGSQPMLQTDLPQPLLTSFTHNIDPGPHGLLAEFNGTDDLGDSVGDIVAEISPFSGDPPFQTFDMADILTNYMRKSGDDPSLFVRPGDDWFHVNASTYDPSDDSVIISSRENFLIKVNYSTHDIVWILGDPTKYWFTFPSLRAKALTLNPGGEYPIGQHAVSVTSDGNIMVFNDGSASANQPAGQPAGSSRTFSEVSTYAVDVTTMTAQNLWNFDYGQSVFSPICGSSYEASGKTYLVDFATAENYTQTRLVGLDANHNVAFDFQYPSPSACAAAWNAIPVPMENLQIK